MSEGLPLPGVNQGAKSNNNWEAGPGRALLGPWPGLLCETPRMALAIAAN